MHHDWLLPAWEELSEEELNRDEIIRHDAASQMSPDSVTYLLCSADL